MEEEYAINNEKSKRDRIIWEKINTMETKSKLLEDLSDMTNVLADREEIALEKSYNTKIQSIKKDLNEKTLDYGLILKYLANHGFNLTEKEYVYMDKIKGLSEEKNLTLKELIKPPIFRKYTTLKNILKKHKASTQQQLSAEELRSVIRTLISNSIRYN